MKKTLTGAALAGLLVLGGASMATAATYPDEGPVITTPVLSPVAGQGVPFTVTVPVGIDSVNFRITGASCGSTLASVVTAVPTVDLAVDKAVSNRTATAVLTPGCPGTHTVIASAPGMDPVSLSVVVAAPAAAGGSGSGSDLAATGGAVPAGVIWAGVGALGLGGIVIAGAAARRRSTSSN